MPIHFAMAYSREPEPPAPADDHQTPEPAEPTAPPSPPSGAEEAAITPEQLARVVRRLESGFYDRAEVREQIARRVREELDP